MAWVLLTVSFASYCINCCLALRAVLTRCHAGSVLQCEELERQTVELRQQVAQAAARQAPLETERSELVAERQQLRDGAERAEVEADQRVRDVRALVDALEAKCRPIDDYISQGKGKTACVKRWASAVLRVESVLCLIDSS